MRNTLPLGEHSNTLLEYFTSHEQQVLGVLLFKGILSQE